MALAQTLLLSWSAAGFFFTPLLCRAVCTSAVPPPKKKNKKDLKRVIPDKKTHPKHVELSPFWVNYNSPTRNKKSKSIFQEASGSSEPQKNMARRSARKAGGLEKQEPMVKQGALHFRPKKHHPYVKSRKNKVPKSIFAQILPGKLVFHSHTAQRRARNFCGSTGAARISQSRPEAFDGLNLGVLRTVGPCWCLLEGKPMGPLRTALKFRCSAVCKHGCASVVRGNLRKPDILSQTNRYGS